jgi:hypothetical protein
VSLRAAVVPGAPLLVPDVAGGSAEVDAELRASVRAAVRWLLSDVDRDQAAGHGAVDTEATGPEAVDAAPVLVIGAAPATGPLTGTWDWRPFGVPARGAGTGEALPTALAVGAWFLDEAAPHRPRSYLGVSAAADAEQCRRLGAERAGRAVRLLVVADGSGCRSEKAPGHLDPRAGAFDTTLVSALRTGDPGQLLTLDPGLAAELLAQGRAPLQVLAGAVAAGPGAGSGGGVRATIDHVSDPYGVLYAVARWWVRA